MLQRKPKQYSYPTFPHAAFMLGQAWLCASIVVCHLFFAVTKRRATSIIHHTQGSLHTLPTMASSRNLGTALSSESSHPISGSTSFTPEAVLLPLNSAEHNISSGNSFNGSVSANDYHGPAPLGASFRVLPHSPHTNFNQPSNIHYVAGSSSTDQPTRSRHTDGGRVSSQTRSFSRNTNSTTPTPVASPLRERPGEFPASDLLRNESTLSTLDLQFNGAQQHNGGSSSNDASPRGSTNGNEQRVAYGRVLSPFSPRGPSTDDSARHFSDSRHPSSQRGSANVANSPQIFAVGSTGQKIEPSFRPNASAFSSSTTSSITSSKPMTFVPGRLGIVKGTEHNPPHTTAGAPERTDGPAAWGRSLSSLPPFVGNSERLFASVPSHTGKSRGASLFAPNSQCNSPDSSSHGGAALFGPSASMSGHRGSHRPPITMSPDQHPASQQRSPSLLPRNIPSTVKGVNSVIHQHPPTAASLTTVLAAHTGAPQLSHRHSLATSQIPFRSPTAPPPLSFNRYMQRNQFVTTVSDEVLTGVASLARVWHPTPALSSLTSHQRMYLSSIELAALTAVEKEMLMLQDTYHILFKLTNPSERRRAMRKQQKQAASLAGRLRAGGSMTSPAISPKHSGNIPLHQGFTTQGRGPNGSPPNSARVHSPGTHQDFRGTSMCANNTRVQRYVKAVLRLASMPEALLNPELGVVDYDLLVGYSMKAKYQSSELSVAGDQKSKGLTLVFRGGMRSVLSAPTAIAIHRNVERRIAATLTTVVPPLAAIPPSHSSGSATSPSNAGGSGRVSARGGGPSASRGNSPSIGGVSLMGSRRLSVGFDDPAGVATVIRDLTSLGSLPSASSYPSGSSGSNAQNEEHFTYFVHYNDAEAISKNNNLEDVMLQAASTGVYQPDHFSPQGRASLRGQPAALLSNSKDGRLASDMLEDSLAVSRRAGEVKWNTPAKKDPHAPDRDTPLKGEASTSFGEVMHVGGHPPDVRLFRNVENSNSVTHSQVSKGGLGNSGFHSTNSTFGDSTMVASSSSHGAPHVSLSAGDALARPLAASERKHLSDPRSIEQSFHDNPIVPSSTLNTPATINDDPVLRQPHQNAPLPLATSIPSFLAVANQYAYYPGDNHPAEVSISGAADEADAELLANMYADYSSEEEEETE